MSFRQRFWVLPTIIALAFLAWVYLLTPKRTLTFTKQNFGCQIPWNWRLGNNPTFLVDAHRPTEGSFYIKVVPVPLGTIRVDSLIERRAFRNFLIAEGQNISNEDIQPFKGHPAYSISFDKVINGQHVFCRATNFIAGKWVYFLQIAEAGADPVQDSQLEKALNSFYLISSTP